MGAIGDYNNDATITDGDKVLGTDEGDAGATKNYLFSTIKAWVKSWIVKADVGLANVDNTADSAKPVSTAQQSALDGKSATGHGHAIGDVTSLQASLDGKASTSHSHATSDVTGLDAALAGKASTSTATTGANGLMSAADKTKLDGVESGATADQSNAEIAAAYNAEVGVVSQVDAEAGTSTTVYRWTPERLKQAIDALAPGGSPAPTGSYLWGAVTEGYLAGGYTTSPQDIIQKFSLVTTAVSNLGSLLNSGINNGPATVSGPTEGYVCGGGSGASRYQAILEFSFGTTAVTTTYGSLLGGKQHGIGLTSSEYGLVVGGYYSFASNVIERFSLTTSGNSIDHGDLTAARYRGAAVSAPSKGYVGLGDNGGAVIERIDYETGAGGVAVANSSSNLGASSGSSGETVALMGGGNGYSNIIEQFTYATEADLVTHANLTAGRYGGGGVSGPNDGFIVSGQTAGATLTPSVDKTSFITTSTSASHSNLSEAILQGGGMQAAS